MSKEFEAIDCMYTQPFAEENALLNDFVDRIVLAVSWEMFKHQEQICYNITECTPPKLKDGTIEYMRNIIRNECGFLSHYIIMRILISYRASNIDLGDEGDWYLQDEFGEEYPDVDRQLREYVYNDYLKYLGKEEADNYFRRIGREDWIIE